MKRYGDAFLVAKSAVLIGKGVQICGFVVATLVMVSGAWGGMATAGKAGSTGETIIFLYFAVMLGSFVAAVIIGLPFVVLGMLVSAQGQVLKATLDTAVTSSPFLDKEQMANVMSI